MQTSTSKTLLTCGMVAGPLYIIVGVIQVLIREGFDPTRHALSLMSNGDLGWIQIANFVVTGLLVLAASLGMRRVLHHGRSGTWGPLLLGLYGLGLVGAGVFVADPALGFPPGTPVGPPATMTQHGMLHFVCGGVGFIGLVGACLVFARRFAKMGQGGWAVFSLATGLIFLASFFGIASGNGRAWIILAFTGAVVLSWLWISALSARLIAEQR